MSRMLYTYLNGDRSFKAPGIKIMQDEMVNRGKPRKAKWSTLSASRFASDFL
jgi:hypothetical protein